MTPNEDPSATPPTIGVVGLGQMGSLLAKRLIGWPGGLCVYDVRPEAARPLVEEGAVLPDSLEELARSAGIISVMVLDDRQVDEVVNGIIPFARPGTVVALHSTIRASTAERLAAQAALTGVAVLDAPVSGGVLGASAGRLALLVGGDRDALDRCREPFGRFADLIVHFGPAGAGTRAKLSRNLINFVGLAAALEAARLADAAGVDIVKLGRVTTHSDALAGGPGAILIRNSSAPLEVDDPLRSIFVHTCALGEKDLALALDLGTELGVDLPLAATALGRLSDYFGLPTEQEET
jgi:3-hydroxyisobutyrate dehydrogenase-like beta-hydroxyacid dehydrogenase